jgi:hypothetical protein
MAIKKNHTGLCCEGGIPHRAKLTINIKRRFKLSKNIKHRVKIYPSMHKTTINKGRRLEQSGTSFAHHPRTEKQGVEIHRSINVEAMTVDQAPGRLLRHGLMS